MSQSLASPDIARTNMGMGVGAIGYIDHIISFQCISLIQKVVDSGAFTIQNIVLLLLILSFDGIRKGFTKFVQNLNVFQHVCTVVAVIRTRLCRDKKRTEIVFEQKDTVPYVTMKFKPTLAFWEGIIQTKKPDINVMYTKTTDKVLEQTNIYEYNLNEIYTNIAIGAPKFEAYLNGGVNILTNHTNGHTSFKAASSIGNNLTYRDNPDAMTFADLLPIPTFSKEFKKLVIDKQGDNIESVKRQMKKINITLIGYLYKSYSYKIFVDTFTYSDFKSDYYATFVTDTYLDMLPLLQLKYPKWDSVTGLYELYYLMCITSPKYAELMRNKTDIFTPKAKMFFGCNIERAQNLNKHLNELIAPNYSYDIRMSMIELPNYTDIKSFMNASLFPEVCSNTTISSCVGVESAIEVIVYGEMQEWIDYVQSITNTAKNSHTKQDESQIYILKLHEEEITENVPNPEYESWEAYVEKLKSSAQDKVNIPPPPSKTCVKTKTNTTIVSNHVNTVYKDMLNLYLRKEDKSRLINCLVQFKEKKELLKSLGIPNKLGVLLYGEPGTGKSSTIHAIASFLRKNIYYIQLNEISTNEQLHMLFNHVTKNCTDGGIIVMEDIDAMTRVVHKRTDETPCSEKLTLEFFLNILQGSLTADGTIFITTTNHLDKLDPAFYRDGRFDVRIEMRAANHDQLNQIYERFFARSVPHGILAKIPEYKYTPAQYITRFRGFLLDTYDDNHDAVILEPFIDK